MKLSFSKIRHWFTKSGVSLFWCWNILFICATLPMLSALPVLFKEWLFDDVPFNYPFLLLVWILAPWGCVILARTWLRGRPEALSFLFFAVEGPFYSLCLYRLMIMRELTPAVMQWLAIAVFGLCVYCFDSVIRPLPKTKEWQIFRLMAMAGLGLVGVYVGALVLLTWSPLFLRGLWELISPSNWLGVLDMFMSSPGVFLALPVIAAIAVFAVGSLLAMPLCMMILCVQAFLQAWRENTLSPRQRLASVLAMLILQGLIFVPLNQQPQKAAFALLASPSLTVAQFTDEQQALRSGLLNAYLSAYRYASSETEANGLAHMYMELLGLTPELAKIPQSVFNHIAKPMLYDGNSMQEDARRAAELYEQYFDTPIQRGERKDIVKAISATYNQDEREAGLVNIDQRKVWVAEQQVHTEAQGDLARVTLDETYVNLTNQPQEIFYLFSLPESAAITGLWLGSSPDKMQPYTIATRGAAQKVYKAEVKRNIDPALLEQVGPRQYRLRAFPVPARPNPRASERFNTDVKLYLRLQYTTFARNGAWPLPVLSEKRNVGWDRHTRRSCNDADCPGDLSSWWPSELPSNKPVLPARHVFELDESGRAVIAQLAQQNVPVVKGKKVTLVVDQSWSMAAHRDALLDTLRWAKQQLAGSAVKVVLTTTPVMHQSPRVVSLASLTDEMLTGFMGGGTVAQLLQQAVEQENEAPDLTVLLTDSGAFDLDVNKTQVRPKSGMLSIVHLGGVLAASYDDATLEAMQTSGGSAFESLREAWEHFSLKQNAAPGFLMRRDGYDFSLIGTAEQPVVGAAAPLFAPIAARLYVASATSKVRPLALADLNKLHAVAQKYEVVTPYSSMLVLVNTQQQQALAEAESQSDRFDRVQEPGTEVLQKPNNPLKASATPEPEEWLLLFVSVVVLGWMMRVRCLQKAGVRCEAF